MTVNPASASTDTFVWANPYGGSWNSAANWADLTTGAIATLAPIPPSSAVINGGINNNFTNIIGNAPANAAQLAINNDVILWNTIAVGATLTVGVSADLDLDGGANILAASLVLDNSASLEAGGSSLQVTGVATLNAAFLLARDSSGMLLGGLIANSINQGVGLQTNTIAVDDNSWMEVGYAAGPTLGALTINTGFTVALSGTIDANLVLNGVLGIQANSTLSIDVADPFGTAQNIGGTGTLALSENSQLTLGVADNAAIRFNGPAGTLVLDTLPTGTISGFGGGDVIEIVNTGTALATGLRFAQTSANVATLSLVRAGRATGSLTLAGNYAGSVFHLGFDANGNSYITLQTIGVAPVQPSVIVGTVGYDVLTATAANQTLTGLGGNDILGAGAFTGIDFKDTTADLNASTITSFGASDLIDLTNMNPNGVSVTFSTATGALIVTSGANSATVALSFGSGLPVGFFTTVSDGASGTDVQYTVPNTDIFVFGTQQAGAYNLPANWQDTTTGATAVPAPSYGNAVTMGGGTSFTDITGNGFAASLTTSGDVLIWGSIVAGSKLSGVSGALTQTGTLALDAGANLTLDGTASVGGLIEVGGGSTFTAAGLFFTGANGALMAIDGGAIRFPAPLSIGGSPTGTVYASSVIAVDANSFIEFGSLGGAIAGALTIDNGTTAELAGTIDGNVVVNGTLIAAGALAIAPFGAAAPTIGGTGTLELTYGATLGIAGPDTAAILFSPTSSGSYATSTETLALGTIMPTVAIAGFTQGDVITVAMIVTSVSWNGARLTLLNGGTTVGSLLLAGIHAANQFQVQPIGNGLSSAITYAATPSTAPGNSVSGTNDAYTWNNSAGAVWNNVSQWIDTTTGGTPTAAPGAGNAVLINNNTGAWTQQIIYGPAAAASLNVTAAAATILVGAFSIGGLFQVDSYGTTSGDVALYGGSSMSAGSLSVSSLLRVVSASLMTILGSANGTFVSGQLIVSSDSTVRIEGGPSVITGTFAVDPTSTTEFGTNNTATAGTMVIDYGQAPTLQGVATIAANLVVNGSLLVYSGTIGGFGGSAGTIGGTGTITIGALGAYGYLVLNAADTAPIVFQAYNANGAAYAFESLELKTPSRTGMITGFIAGDAIIIDCNVTGATFVQNSGTPGTLTLTDGAVTVGTLTLNGNYAGVLFQVDLAAQTGVATITLQPATAAAAAGVINTGGDAYSWTGTSGASWTTAANWLDTTTGTTPTAVPGSADAVIIAGNVSTGHYTAIGGNGATTDLSITGNVLLTGHVAVGGTVHISSGSGPAGALTLQGGAGLTAAGSAEIFGRFEVGGGSSSTITGYALLFSGSLLALDGSVVQAGGLIGDGSGDVIAVDPNSAIRIGTSAGTAAGALTIAAGAPAEFTGLIYGSVVANGNLWVGGGGTLLIDMTATAEIDPYAASPTISGTGLLLLTEGSTLGLGVADTATIQFAGPNATLALAVIPFALINGFASGDQIDIDQAVTGLTYAQPKSTFATLTLTDGANIVGVLKFTGSFTSSNDAFHLDSAANGASAVITLQTLQIAPVQPTLIYGTVGSDTLAATANGQTISGYGGSDVLSGASYTGVVFKDYSFYLSGSEVENFNSTDKVDLIDVTASSATATYSGGVLTVSDGTHAAAFSLSFTNYPLTGSFHVASDGASGTLLTWS